MTAPDLPICAVIPDVLAALQQHPAVLLSAPPGAGKSTYLPLTLLELPWLSGTILLLEPRRLAARSIAERLSSQLGERCGQTVGYRMRAEAKVSAATRLEVVTEGVLTRRLQQDPELNGVSLIIFDEFHERSVQAELALALALDVQEGLRDDLRLLVMSATLDDQGLRNLLPDAPLVSSAGRAHPVTVLHQPYPPHQALEEAVSQAVCQLLAQESGSALVFLPGMGEIERVSRRLEGRLPPDTQVCPLYGALTLAEQQRAIALAPSGQRKVVLATNLAETSLTIEGVRLVIDSGTERLASFDPRSGLTRLQTTRIAKASMTQRAGRAGRTEPGVCLRLYSSEQAERATEFTPPELCRSDLSAIWLELLQWGCSSWQSLRFIDYPPVAHQAAAETLLRRLQATDESGRLTARGRELAVLGCDPRHGVLLLSGRERGEAALAARLVALLEEPPRTQVTPDPDRLTARQRQRADTLLGRLTPNTARSTENNTYSAPDLIAELLASAYPDRIGVARSHDGRFQLSGGNGAFIEADSPLAAQRALVAPSLILGASSREARILLAWPVSSLEALAAQLPQLVSEQMALEWDEARGTLRALLRRRLGALTLSEQPMSAPEPAQMRQALLDWVAEQGLAVLNWDESAVQLRARLQCAARWLPELPWPSVEDEALLASLDSWLGPQLEGVRDVRGLRQLDLSAALNNLLDWQQRQRLEQLLPVCYTVPTGSRIAIRYAPDADPVLAVRLQEVFGESASPRIADGRVALVLELLSPARRPLQITRDLQAFWQGAYKEVQKEMKGRYPKHVWPDDPANTQATRATKRHWQG